MKIAGYLRVSTQRQADEGVSIEAQKDIILRHCLMLELIDSEEDIGWYLDDGWSAKSLERPAMRSLIADMKNKRFTMVFAYDMSRISRDTYDMIAFLKIADKYGIVIKYIYGDNKFETATEKFVTTVHVAAYQFEREHTAERTRDAIIHIADEGRYPFGGMLHYGYKRDEDKNLVIDEERAVVVRSIFDMASKGYRMSEIADVANLLQDEIIFTGARVRRYLSNTKYSGMVSVFGKEYDNLVPAIVTPEMQKKAIQGLVIHRQKSDNYVFTDVLVCKKCGEILRCKSGYGKMKKLYFYYVCPQCGGKISQIDMDQQMSLTMPQAFDRDMQEHLANLRRIRRNLKSRHNTTYRKYRNGEISDTTYDSVNQLYEAELEALDARIEAMEHSVGTASYSGLETAEQKKLFVEKYIYRILIDTKHKKILKIEYKE